MTKVTKIMIIDDDVRVSALISRAAEEIGLSSIVYDHKTDLIQFCKVHNPDLIMLDVFMPEQDGFEVLRLLKHYDSELPIIMLSGDPGFCNMAAEYGTVIGLNIALTMGKPFRIGELRNVLIRLAEIEETFYVGHKKYVTKH